MQMNATIASLVERLSCLENEVVGRSSEDPPSEMQALLLQAINEGIGDQREQIFEMLKSQPGWLAWFAEKIKEKPVKQRN